MREGGKGKERKANKHRKGGEKGRADGEEIKGGQWRKRGAAEWKMV